MNNYEQLGVAGEGQYGIVFKCRQKASGHMVAIKQFKENEDEDEEAARIIQREAEILKMLKHENIVETQDIFREKGVLHVVFEYIDKCLMDIMEDHPRGLAADTARKLTGQLTRAVEHCHRHSVMHRDIKPENLLVNSATLDLKLCDFGSACKIASQKVLTDYCATRWYRAPELLVRFNNYGPGVDIWGLGCVAAEMISGQALFPGDSDIDQLFIIINALGPLTREQTERCFELTGFVKFPEVGERQTLKKRLGHAATDQQLQLLSRIFVMDPAERLTARTALSLPWLSECASSSPPVSARALNSQHEQNNRTPRQRPAADPDFGVPAKPRVQRVLGVPGGGGSGGKEKPVGIVASREPQRYRPQDPEPESVTSFQANGSGSTHQASAMNVEECEESIAEDISEVGSIPEDCGSGSPGSLASTPAKGSRTPSGSASPSTSLLTPRMSGRSASEGRLSKPVGIVSAGATPVPDLHDSMMSIQMGSPSLSRQQGKPRLRGAQESTQSIQESLPSRTQGAFEESIIEEVSDEELSNSRAVEPRDPPSARAAGMPPRLGTAGGVSSALSSGPSARSTRHIRRPMSGSSARSSSLTPMD